MKPSIGRIVIYRSRTGDYDVPAIVNATQATLNPKGVEAGYVPELTSENHVHLTVLTPGIPNTGHSAKEAEESTFQTRGPVAAQPSSGGSYQEWDIPPAPLNAVSNEPEPTPGTWRWPVRVS